MWLRSTDDAWRKAQESMTTEGSDRIPCPHCGGEIKRAAKICKHCKETVPVTAAGTRRSSLAVTAQRKETTVDSAVRPERGAAPDPGPGLRALGLVPMLLTYAVVAIGVVFALVPLALEEHTEGLHPGRVLAVACVLAFFVGSAYLGRKVPSAPPPASTLNALLIRRPLLGGCLRVALAMALLVETSQTVPVA